MHLLTCPAIAAFLALPNFGQWTKTTIINLGAVAFVLGVLVFVHEFGHYLVAKLFRVRVEVFSLGFGKRLWGFRRGDTDYRISALPLGGYVKMSGENPMEDRTGDPGEFTSHPRWQRFLIAIAGPAMNIILAIVVLTGVFMIHDEEPAYFSQAVVIGAVEQGSPADKAGIKAGDRITRIQNLQSPTWKQVIPEVLISPNQQLEVEVQRGSQIIQTKVVPQPDGPDRIGYAGWGPPEPALVGKVDPDLPAAKAGIKTGDQIVAFNATPVQDMSQFIELLQQSKSDPVQLTVLRNGTEQKLTVVPQLMDQELGRGGRYRIGFAPASKMIVRQLPFGEAFSKSVASCEDNSLLIFRLIPRLLQNKNSLRQMSGPIGIMERSGEAAVAGWWILLEFMAAVSMSLAVFNLLPIPILDGGLVLMLLIEAIIRRDIKQQIKERVYQVAFVFLILFAAIVIYNDIAKKFHV